MPKGFGSTAKILVVALVFIPALLPQTAGRGRNARPQITEAINERRLHTLHGNTRQEANAQNDRGAVSADLAMDHMLLQLQRSAAQEQAVRQFVDQLHDPASPSFHHWLTADQFGQAYGPAQQDIETVVQWLKSHGFAVNFVSPSGMSIDFSGTAGQVREAFRTDIHHLNVNGQAHIANMSDPQIPEALAPAVAGVVSLHDFVPHAMKTAHPNYTFDSGSSTYQALSPADLATIYNLNPLFSSGITGAGQTIAVIEDSNLYSDSDWTTFRDTFGLSQYSKGSLTSVHPAPSSAGSNCADPGVLAGDDSEAILDAEWASAAAPDAAIVVASCGNTRTTFGGLIAMQNLISAPNPPSIISISYGECEAQSGAAANAAFNATYQQAAAEGVSVFVAAGDEGAAGCDAGAKSATHGIGVSGWASTPYNVAVGGTDFADSYAHSNSTYWSSSNSGTYLSALSYVPEIPWNDTCASTLLAGYFGFDSSFGSDGFCASSKGRKYVSVAAGSGGPSGCATGRPSQNSVVSGTCGGYAKPSWQSGLAGIPDDGVRDLPDVSLFAGAGVWGHFYVYCWSNRRAGGAACTSDPSAWSGAGGTSFSSPIVAGIQALVNQRTGSPQGNPNYVYYKLAAIGSGTCDSSAGDTSGSPCIFHNVTQGDITVNCGGTSSCFGAVAAGTGSANINGGLSLSSDSFTPAFGAAPGWNFATGIGTINAYNLVMNWNSGQ